MRHTHVWPLSSVSTPTEEVVRVLAVEAWSAEDMSSDVDTPNLDYKRTNNVDIYIATMRMKVVGFAFHHICILNSNRL